MNLIDRSAFLVGQFTERIFAVRSNPRRFRHFALVDGFRLSAVRRFDIQVFDRTHVFKRQFSVLAPGAEADRVRDFAVVGQIND